MADAAKTATTSGGSSTNGAERGGEGRVGLAKTQQLHIHLSPACSPVSGGPGRALFVALSTEQRLIREDGEAVAVQCMMGSRPDGSRCILYIPGTREASGGPQISRESRTTTDRSSQGRPERVKGLPCPHASLWTRRNGPRSPTPRHSPLVSQRPQPAVTTTTDVADVSGRLPSPGIGFVSQPVWPAHWAAR